MRRDIINIDPDLCTGCGDCVQACPEGAIQLVDGKARLVADNYCDGLGACVGECPEGAISVDARESEPYDERRVMDNIIPQGDEMVRLHLRHLKDHGAKQWLQEALSYLEEKGIPAPKAWDTEESQDCSCLTIHPPSASSEDVQWPIQLQLVPVRAPFLKGKELLLAANCSGFVREGIKDLYGKAAALVTACPKLDRDVPLYAEKIAAIVDDGGVTGITVVTMEVPCCRGLVKLVQDARVQASRKVPVTHVTLSRAGEVLSMKRL